MYQKYINCIYWLRECFGDYSGVNCNVIKINPVNYNYSEKVVDILSKFYHSLGVIGFKIVQMSK